MKEVAVEVGLHLMQEEVVVVEQYLKEEKHWLRWVGSRLSRDVGLR